MPTIVCSSCRRPWVDFKYTACPHCGMGVDGAVAAPAPDVASGGEVSGAFRNYARNRQQEDTVRAMLSRNEELLCIVEESHRFISATSSRLILHEKSGGYSAIRKGGISVIEVSQGPGSEQFLKVYFGGGMSRTIGAPNREQAAAIVSAATG